MKSILRNLAPKSVFRHFEAISTIPHGSGNTDKIADYCQEIAQKAGCFVIRDSLNNLIITIPPSKGYENSPVVILQGHLDMVCDKLPESHHDFTKDPLPIQVEDEWILSDKTTLGGDDGIAVAMILAIAEDRRLNHGKIYGILTVDEEIGMIGANALDCSPCFDADVMINLDSENEKEIVAGCAGGVTINTTYPLRFTKAKGLFTRLTLSGLDGGHSGEMIHRYGFNANILMGEILNQLEKKLNLSIIAVNGGEQDNVIPNNACAEILIGANQKDMLTETIAELEKMLQKSGGSNDRNLTIRADFGEVKETMVMGRDSEQLVLFVLIMTPNGLQASGRMIEGLPDTSLNLGVLKTVDKKLSLDYLIRSNQIVTRDRMTEKLRDFTTYLGGTMNVQSAYPPWEYKKDSTLHELVLNRSGELFGTRPKVTTIHAGLECGIFAEKLPHVDIISIGPDLPDIHTPKEQLSIPSTQRTWQLLIDVLENLK